MVCNNCKNNVETIYHCTVCDDFNLCVNCFDSNGHIHKMEKIGVGLDGSFTCDKKQINPQKARKSLIKRWSQPIVHARQCRDVNCSLPKCQKMKSIIQHVKSCKLKLRMSCNICRQIIPLSYNHSKDCKDAQCPVLYCWKIGPKLKEFHLPQRFSQAKVVRLHVPDGELMHLVLLPSRGNSSNTTQPSTGA